jgi:hypothetical protein
MFPVTRDNLSFADVSHFWSRYIETAQPPELLALLEQAWWRGEFRGLAETTRLQLLQSMFRSLRERADLGIVFVRVGDDPAPTVTELPDGLMNVDMRHVIPVPSDDVSGWNEQTCEQAFEALAQTSSLESYPDLAPFFASIKLSFEEFDRWRKTRGYPKPAFWGGPAALTMTPEATLGERDQAAQTSRPKNRTAGRKSRFAAPILSAVFNLMNHHGDLSDDDPEWSVQADVERAVRDKLGDDGPRAVSTVRRYVSSSITEWRKSKITDGR